MNRDGIKQRIAYLIEHGGAYPEDRRADWKGWAILVLLVFNTIAELTHMLR